MSLVFLIVLGFLAGIFSGLFGIGGGVIIVPALVYLLHYNQHAAQGTSMAMLLPPIGILAAWRYWQTGHVHVKAAAILAMTFFVGALIGAHFAIGIPEQLMKRIFGGALTVIGIIMIFGR